jgi:hypothetical protein
MPLGERFENTKPLPFDSEWQGFCGTPKARDSNPPLRVRKSIAEFLKVRGRFSRSTGVEGRHQIQELRLTEILMSDNPFRFDNWLNHDGDGGTKTKDEVLLGQNNRIHSPDDSDLISETLTGATIIDVRSPGQRSVSRKRWLL